MKSFLNKPYRETGTFKSKLLSILAFGLFIFLFLFIFKPFGIAALKVKTGDMILITLGFGVITSAVLLIFIFILEPFFKNRLTTLGKNIAWDLLIAASIGAVNYFYIYLIFKLNFDFSGLLSGIWTAILVGSIPVTVNHILTYNKLYREALLEAAIQEDEIIPDGEILLTAGYSRNKYVVNPKDILYMCSNDNYVTIVTISNNVRNKTTIRGTLKSIENELRDYPGFIRCHKCFIVNLHYVEKAYGGRQNMKLKISYTTTEIPVSRSHTEYFMKKIKR
ncbi:MAG TPA: LytTR family DNA-binding domain-containing protein [Bacteroidales bacterium]|nr:LytTR family DNA-binding domain-containing protein [Bacteroidales bacterium]